MFPFTVNPNKLNLPTRITTTATSTRHKNLKATHKSKEPIIVPAEAILAKGTNDSDLRCSPGRVMSLRLFDVESDVNQIMNTRKLNCRWHVGKGENRP